MASNARPSTREAWYRIHLWLGIGLGLYWVMLGVTGTLLVFGRELDRYLNPELLTVVPGPARQPVSAILASFERSHPGVPVTNLGFPTRVDDVYTVRVGPTQPSQLRVYLDPYTARVVGERNLANSLYGFLVSLHYTLYLGPAGRVLNGWGSLLMLVAFASGIWLWWPAAPVSAAIWKARLSVRSDAGTSRFLYDLHNATGVYSLVFALIFTLTALEFAFPNQVRPMLHALGGSTITAASGLRQLPDTGGPQDVDALVAIADRAAPGQLFGLEVPQSVAGEIHVTKSLDAYDYTRARVEITVDTRTGDVRSIHDSRTESLGDALIRWCVPLHYGIWGGMATKVLYFLLGLLPVVSFITGFWKWRRRAGRVAVTRQPLNI